MTVFYCLRDEVHHCCCLLLFPQLILRSFVSEVVHYVTWVEYPTPILTIFQDCYMKNPQASFGTKTSSAISFCWLENHPAHWAFLEVTDINSNSLQILHFKLMFCLILEKPDPLSVTLIKLNFKQSFYLISTSVTVNPIPEPPPVINATLPERRSGRKK